MDRKTRIQLAAFFVGIYLTTALAVWVSIQAYHFIKEHIVCICPTTEQPSKPVAPDAISDMMAKLQDAQHYLDMHQPHVVARIKELGVEVPPFSIEAPVIVELRQAINALVVSS